MKTPLNTLPEQRVSSGHYRATFAAATLGLLLLNLPVVEVQAEPVQVYILMGQSNMLGYGGVTGGTDGKLDYAVHNKGLYPYLRGGRNSWAAPRDDVRNVRVQGSGGATPGSPGNVIRNDWLSVEGHNNIGPEFGIGHHLGEAIEAPVMLLKSAIGNRALGWDLLPPGSVQYNHDGYTYPGFGGSPERWPIRTRPVPISWYAGLQYEGDVSRAKAVLDNLATYYPGATEYVVAGFFWWQGDRDRYTEGHAIRYEQNLVQLIEQLRLEFNAPDAKFVCATLGQTVIGAGGNDGLILDAQLAISDAVKYPQFEGDVATVYSHPLSKGGASNSHYNGNAETYMNVGEAMGEAMVNLLVPGPVGFADWAGGFTLVDAGFNGDDDGDNLPNGIEGLFGSRPDVANTGLTQVGKAGNTVTFTHPNPDEADVLSDVSGSYEWSPDCVTWYRSDGLEGPGDTTVTTSATPNSPTANLTTVQANIAGTVPAELFLRAVATRD